MVRGVLLVFVLVFAAGAEALAEPTEPANPPYGRNPAAGGFISVDGARLYFEIYGAGDPLLLLHGNGGNIAAMEPQIQYFAQNYRVIVPDCRGRGQSELGSAPLTYERMARDLAALIDHLQLEPAYVVGRSDGAILALLLGIRFPEKTRKIAAFSANLVPDLTAVYSSDEIEADLREAEEMLHRGDSSKDWKLIRELNKLMLEQPQLTPDDLNKIRCPVLVLSGDRDVIREEHTLLIYRSIPQANLCIFPGGTHSITNENPALFNSTVETFLRSPFRGEEARK